jgi:hypothetical protein
MIRDFAQLSCNIDQRPKEAKTPTPISFNVNDALVGIQHYTTKNNSIIKIKQSGLYFLIVAPQIGRKKGSTSRYLDVWLRKNGEDVANSNIRANLYHGTSKDVIVNQSMIPLFREDELQVMMSVEAADEGIGLEAIKPKGEPTIPSVILSMRMVEEYDELLEEEIFKKSN